MLKTSLLLVLLLCNFLTPKAGVQVNDFQNDPGVIESSFEYSLSKLDTSSSGSGDLRKNQSFLFIFSSFNSENLFATLSFNDSNFLFSTYSSELFYPSPKPRGPPTLLI